MSLQLTFTKCGSRRTPVPLNTSIPLYPYTILSQKVSKDVKQDDDNVDKNVQLKPQQTKLLSKKNVFFWILALISKAFDKNFEKCVTFDEPRKAIRITIID